MFVQNSKRYIVKGVTNMGICVVAKIIRTLDRLELEKL